MSATPTEQFIDALGRLERDHDPEPLVGLFTDDCTLQNVTVGEDHHGRDGARGFWSEDRKLFDEVRSEFRNVIVDGDRAALEWTRHGTAHDGGAVEYAGVSVIEFSGEQVARFMGYFHPRELGRQTQP